MNTLLEALDAQNNDDIEAFGLAGNEEIGEDAHSCDSRGSSWKPNLYHVRAAQAGIPGCPAMEQNLINTLEH